MSASEATTCAPRPRAAGLSGRQAALILLLLMAASYPHWRLIDPHIPITNETDLDGLMKLRGIEADPSPRAALGWFIGDDPQRVHTFRPVPAVSLWVEFRLWGWTRWAYQVMNLVYLAFTALALVWVCRVLGMPMVFAVGAGGIFMALPSRGCYAVVMLVATRHDLFCTLFSVLAFGCLLAWLEVGRRRYLAGVIVWSLLALLSKEMAAILAPMFIVTALAHWRRVPLRRMVVASAGVVAVTIVWFIWYRLAETNMAASPHPSHSFGGMVELLIERRDNTVFFFTGALCRPLTMVWRYVFGGAHLAMFCSVDFWRRCLHLLVFATALGLTWRHARRWLVLLYIWKVFAYLPVLPLSDTWGWYEFMPHVLDAILPVSVAWVLWEPLEVPGRLRRWWGQRSAPPDQ